MFKPCFSITYAHSCEKCKKTKKESRYQGCKKCIDFHNDLNSCSSPFNSRTDYRLSQNKKLEKAEIISYKKREKSEQSISSELSDSKIKSFDDLLKFYKSVSSLKTNKICPSCNKSIDINKCAWCDVFDNSGKNHFPKYYKLTLKNKERTIDENVINILKKVIFGSHNDSCCCKDNFEYKKDHYPLLKDEKTEEDTSQFPAHAPLKRKPGKGTLKLKRWCMNQLKTENSREDELFNNTQRSYCVHHLSYGSASIGKYTNSPTPKLSFLLSPKEISSDSSSYEDCYNFKEYQDTRKLSEQFQYRQCKKRKKISTNKDPGSSSKRKPSKGSSIRNTSKTLHSAAKILEKLESACKDTDSEESNSDDY